MPLHRRTVLSLLLAFSAGGMRVAPAQEVTRAPSTRIRMLVPELPVLGERDPQGHPTGLVVDQARAILDRAGIPATIELVPAVRLYAELARAEVTPAGAPAETSGPKTYGMIALPIRAPYQAIVPLALTMSARLVAAARRGVPLATLEDLRQVGPVAVSASGTQALTPVIQQYGLAVQTVPSVVNGLRMLAHGRVNAILGIAAAIDMVAREDGLADQLGDRLEITTMDAWLACAPTARTAPETAALREAAEALYREGRLEAIARQHFHKADSGS
ncbi:type 2 periplasmic-binding domain-containing protein [Nitrospirillum pindoramense]|uniref:ABC-type amino acid transport substrate-binding protein n=1 Tax=Nitrospirillum amazonense TaxID=28077 RepID=A0A560GYN5_9PROT|nr:hypothetical protein [Nitrospirillum amazonense]TWB38530.1 ABC-type amino acid transport substrate-binding protein [Nitrospirillum amazonense]